MNEGGNRYSGLKKVLITKSLTGISHHNRTVFSIPLGIKL